MIKQLYIWGKKLMRKISEDHISAYAAQATFFTLLSVIPFITLLLSLVTYMPFTEDDLIQLIMTIVPYEFSEYVQNIINGIYVSKAGLVLSVSVFILFWSASKGIASLIAGLNYMYRAEETRNFFMIRGISIIYTFFMMVMLIIMLTIFVFGNRIYYEMVQRLSDFGDFTGLIMALRTLIGCLILFIFITLIYMVLPNRKIHYKSLIIGSLSATVLWMTISLGFSIYIDNFGSYENAYGSLAGVVFGMLWLYYCMYSLLLGAEMNHFVSQGYLTHVKKVIK